MRMLDLSLNTPVTMAVIWLTLPALIATRVIKPYWLAPAAQLRWTSGLIACFALLGTDGQTAEVPGWIATTLGLGLIVNVVVELNHLLKLWVSAGIAHEPFCKHLERRNPAGAQPIEETKLRSQTGLTPAIRLPELPYRSIARYTIVFLVTAMLGLGNQVWAWAMQRLHPGCTGLCWRWGPVPWAIAALTLCYLPLSAVLVITHLRRRRKGPPPAAPTLRRHRPMRAVPPRSRRASGMH